MSEGIKSVTSTACRRRMKMAYEYTRVTQVFTLSSVPQCWVYPVSLLVQAYNTTVLTEGEELVMTPNFPEEEVLAMN